MKNLFTTLLILFTALLAGSTSLKAQNPGITINYATDSSQAGNCTYPSMMGFLAFGYAVGYPVGDSVLVEISFGDGNDTSFYSIIYQYSFWIYADHTYLLPGSYNVLFTVTGSDGDSDTFIVSGVQIATCENISGSVFLDQNSNCIFDAGETPLVYRYISIISGGAFAGWALTDSMGNYSAYVPVGFTYTVELWNNNQTLACPVSGQYTVTSLPSTNNNFGISCSVAQFDLSPDVSGQGFRVNNNSSLWISAGNNIISCSPPTATVTLTLDPMLSYVSSTVTPVSVVGQDVVFNAGQLSGVGPEWYSLVTVLTDPGAAIGDTLCVTITVDPSAGDADPSNNVLTACYPVRNSCDPNEKYEIHAGVGTGYISQNARLDYTIMFQNLGNDDAYNVVIVDTLDSNLDISTLEFKAFSHEPVIRIIGNNILKFEFHNINLPAASVNEPESHGFVSYKISPVAGLADGTEIDNRADIYFDFNAAILTNITTDIIDISLGIPDFGTLSTSVYPNPALDYFSVKSDSKELTLFIYDVAGREVFNKQIISEEKISTKGLQSGLYTVVIQSPDKTNIAKLIIQ